MQVKKVIKNPQKGITPYLSSQMWKTFLRKREKKVENNAGFF